MIPTSEPAAASTRPSISGLANVQRTLAEAYARAVARKGERSFHFALAGNAVSLRIAGAELSDHASRALRHIESTPSSEPLTICVWDGNDLPGPAPVAEEWLQQLSQPRTHYRESEPIRASYARADAGLSLLDIEARQAFYWVPEARRWPANDLAGPLRTLLHWWMSLQAMSLVHAAAVGVPGGCALIAGRGGSGKSTTALKCLLDGLLYISDDYCLLGGAGPPIVHSVYCSAKLQPDNLARFPSLALHVANPARGAGEKAVVHIDSLFPERLVKQLPVRTILFPVMSSGPPALKQIGPAQALRLLAPSSLLQLPGTPRSNLSSMAKLVGAVASFELQLGDDIDLLPRLIEAKLHSLCEAGAA